MPSSSLLPELCEGDYPIFDDCQSLYDDDADFVPAEMKAVADELKTYTTLQPARPQQYRAITESHSIIKSPFLSGGSDDYDLLSWKTKHPRVWSPSEVLDWLYFFAEHERVDCQRLHGENFRTVDGPLLCQMSREEFMEREPEYGSRIYDLLRQVLDNANFVAPKEPSAMIEDFITDAPMDLTSPSVYERCTRDHEHSDLCMVDSLLPDKITTVAIGEHIYDIDLDIQGLPLCLSNFSTATSSNPSLRNGSSDGGYDTGSDVDSIGYEGDLNCSDVFDRTYQTLGSTGIKQEEPDTFLRIPNPHSVQSGMARLDKPRKRPPGRPRKIHLPQDLTNNTQSSPAIRKRSGTGSKGNHLWEFIRDTLKNPTCNPKLLKWENHAEGVFKFVNSEAVAKMWGQKKNNKGMTYEKLSRAMRFCRTAGYFTDVPKKKKVPTATLR